MFAIKDAAVRNTAYPV